MLLWVPLILCMQEYDLVLMKIHLLFFKTQFLIQECASLITKPNFISTLSYAIDNPLHYQKVGIVFIFSSPKKVIFY